MAVAEWEQEAAAAEAQGEVQWSWKTATSYRAQKLGRGSAFAVRSCCERKKRQEDPATALLPRNWVSK